ncbi:MAG: pyruvate kinase [Eubacteriales bacterium]|nr:pyruvate kinase [Eubacteriales bacterium]
MDIYGTIGPACLDLNVLKEMFANGMTGMRLNLSHITIKDAAPMIELYQKAAKEAGVKNPKLLIDMQGSEIRVEAMDNPMELCEDKTVILGQGGVPIPAFLIPYLKEGQTLLLDDGKMKLEVMEQNVNHVICRVLRGGILKGRKSIAVENCAIPVPTLTVQDKENLKEAKAYGVTGIMQPFVRSSEDLKEVKKAMEETGCGDLTLLAKIENQYGIRNLSTFFEWADEIVIARGDLGNAMPLWELPGVQKRIQNICKEANMPFMVVTQMLSSMEHSKVPTRAEVSDIYNAAYDGASSVMVTGETAVGDYPAEVIRYLANTAKEGWKDRLA